MQRKFPIYLLMASLLLLLGLVGGPSSSNAPKQTTQISQSSKVKKSTGEAKQATMAQDQQSTTDNGQTAQPSAKSTGEGNENVQANNESAKEQNNRSTQQAPSASQSSAAAPKPVVAGDSASKGTTTPAPAPVKPAAPPLEKLSVSFSIVGPKEDHSSDTSTQNIAIKDGETVLDVLVAAVGKNNVDYSGSGATAYVSGINNIYEFDYGAKSGWVFKLNGASLNKSIGTVTVKNGDKIQCLFTE